VTDRKTLSPLMQELAGYVAAAPSRALPAPVAEKAKHHLLDTLAAMVSGSRLLPGRRAIAFAAAQGGTPEAGVVGSTLVTSAINAALANGMHGHSDETDDAYYLALVHPGCSVIPAALAVAERERAGGAALLGAIVLGYDVCVRTSHALGVEKFRSSGHSTHSFGGTMGSAAAAAALLGLTFDQARYMISYAAQQCSGLSCWARDIEHVEKAFHFGGMPARNGVTAAIMASMGFTAVEDVLAGDRSFFHAFAAFAEPRRLVDGLGERFDIMATAIKRWAIGYPIQAPIDAVSNLVARHKLSAADVAHVRVAIDEQGAKTTNARTMASINIQHLVALMLVDGAITFKSAHDAARVSDPEILALKARVELVGSAELNKPDTTESIVEVTTHDGRALRHHTTAVLGTPGNPMTRTDLEVKCRDLLVPVIGAARTDELIATVWDIEKVGDARALRKLLMAE